MKERDIQITIVEYVRACHKKCVIFAIPNGGSRNAREGANLKREGVLAGVSDLCVMFDNGKCSWVEVKTKKGRQSDTQKQFEENCNKLGHEYILVRSFEEFEKWIKKKDSE